MNRLSSSVLVGIFSRGWSAFLSIALVPLYIRILGVESYAAIGFFGSLQGVLFLLDIGLAPMLTREIARRPLHESRERKYLADLVRTLEIAYWGLASIAGAVLIIFTPTIINSWINPSSLSSDELRLAFAYGAVSLLLQWPSVLYSAGLAGLHKQATLGWMAVIFGTLRTCGSAIVLYFFSGTLSAFFAWQILVSTAQTVSMAMLLYRALPQIRSEGKLNLRAVSTNRHFAGAMGLIAVFSTLATQLDKIVLSKVVTLENFGYYMLAWSVSSAIYVVVTPVFSVLYPRFSTLSASGSNEQVSDLYNFGSEVMSFLVVPLAAFLLFFSDSLLNAWMQNQRITQSVAATLCVLTVGNAINGMMNIPYAVQLAMGRTRLPIVANLAGVLGLVPAIFFLGRSEGIVGAALAWLLFNLLYLVSCQYITHRTILSGGLVRWYFQFLLKPCAVAALAGWLLSSHIEWSEFRAMRIGQLFFSLGLIYLAVLLVLGRLRGGFVRVLLGGVKRLRRFV